MIRVFTESNGLKHWPSFNTFEAAMQYIENNSGEFDNQEILLIVDFYTLKTRFVRAELKISFREINC